MNNSPLPVVGASLEHRIVTCATAVEKQQWIDTLRTQAKTGPACSATKPQSLKVGVQGYCNMVICQQITLNRYLIAHW